MSLKNYEKEVEHLGESQGVKDHDHDMIHDLSRRLDALWRFLLTSACSPTSSRLRRSLAADARR